MTDPLDAIQRDGGFTLNPRTGELLIAGQSSGYAVAVPGTERVVGTGSITRAEFQAAFALVVREYGELLGSDRFVGGWWSEDRGIYMVEITDVLHVDRATAVRTGVDRHQEGILDLSTGEFIPTGGHGDGPIEG